MKSFSRRDMLRGLTTAAATSAATIVPMTLAPLTLARPGLAQAQANPIRATKLADNLYVLMGDGGNVAVLVSNDGLFMVDGGLPDRAPDMIKAVAGVSKKPVVTLFDTHWHADHTGSNVALGEKGAKIVAHDNVRTRLSTTQTMELFHRTFNPLPPAGIPGVIFHEPGTIAFGAESVQYAPVEPAHTDGDTYLFFPKANVLHTGDLLFNGFYPVIDYSSKGWLGGMVAAEDKLLTIGDGKTQIIPGHGPLAARADLQASRDMLATVLGRLEPMLKAGKNVDEVVAAAPTKDLDGRWGGGMLKPDDFTRMAYTGMLKHSQVS